MSGRRRDIRYQEAKEDLGVEERVRGSGVQEFKSSGVQEDEEKDNAETLRAPRNAEKAGTEEFGAEMTEGPFGMTGGGRRQLS